MAQYVPTARMYWDSVPSSGWLSRQEASAHEVAPAFDHAALHVSNLERSTSFYETFGLKRIADPFKDDRHVWLSLGSHEQLHLLSGGTANLESDMNVHIAIRVSSIPALTARLDQLKIVYYNSKREPHTVTKRPDGASQIYLQDPDGYWLEFNDVKP